MNTRTSAAMILTLCSVIIGTVPRSSLAQKRAAAAATDIAGISPGMTPDEVVARCNRNLTTPKVMSHYEGGPEEVKMAMMMPTSPASLVTLAEAKHFGRYLVSITCGGKDGIVSAMFAPPPGESRVTYVVHEPSAQWTGSSASAFLARIQTQFGPATAEFTTEPEAPNRPNRYRVLKWLFPSNGRDCAPRATDQFNVEPAIGCAMTATLRFLVYGDSLSGAKLYLGDPSLTASRRQTHLEELLKERTLATNARAAVQEQLAAIQGERARVRDSLNVRESLEDDRRRAPGNFNVFDVLLGAPVASIPRCPRTDARATIETTCQGPTEPRPSYSDVPLAHQQPDPPVPLDPLALPLEVLGMPLETVNVTLGRAATPDWAGMAHLRLAVVSGQIVAIAAGPVLLDPNQAARIIEQKYPGLANDPRHAARTQLVTCSNNDRQPKQEPFRLQTWELGSVQVSYVPICLRTERIGAEFRFVTTTYLKLLAAAGQARDVARQARDVARQRYESSQPKM